MMRLDQPRNVQQLLRLAGCCIASSGADLSGHQLEQPLLLQDQQRAGNLSMQSGLHVVLHLVYARAGVPHPGPDCL
jgi:hypothetical protein